MFNFIYKKLFKFGKLVSLIFIFISIAAIVISAIAYLGAEKKEKNPSFDDIKMFYEGGQQTKETDFKNIEERQEVEKIYGERIKEIVKQYNFGAENYNAVLQCVIEVPDNKRKDFLNSTVNFVNRALEYEKVNKKGITAPDMFNTHKNLYFEMLQKQKGNEAEASSTKMYSIGGIIIGLLLFTLFLCVPIFIAIEENTRKIQ